MAKGIRLEFDTKLAQAIIAIKARDEALANAKNAKEKAISELNDLISKRLKDDDIKKDSKKRLKILEINQNPLDYLSFESGERLSTTPVELRALAEKYKTSFSNLNATKENPADSSKIPASK